MLGRSLTRLLPSLLNNSSGVAAQTGRCIASSSARLEEVAQQAGPKEFTEMWTKRAPSNMEVPQLPSSHQRKAESMKAQGDLFPVNLSTPHSMIADATQKDTVVLPGMEGLFGVKANHVPVISQLKPGVVELHSGSEVEKYFISGGWAYVHPDGVTDIQALEVVTLDQVDHAAVKSALSAASSAPAADDYDAAVNRTAVELYAALDAALEQKA
ncbi:ATP synthase [Dunaliella salina]|uniref:ATP synthase n=1 Tax=Dunaliella salina TaxID=3046 RepID=A0ABQ7H5B0_DUNSA|nr:ATP synthase [Dunaliella salina]|eukprot:KAF5842037.1 ATP synthase [Dunaliella salina]